MSPKEQKMLAAISGERAREYVATLASTRDRISGTEAEHESAQRVRELLSPYVDECQLEGWPVVTYIRGKGMLDVLSPVRRSIPCEVNPVSGSGRGEGLLIDAGHGTRADYERLEGRIEGQPALVTNDAARRGGWFPHLALEAKKWGASCLVCHNPDIRDDLISVWVIDVDFPVLSVSNQSAAELRALMAEHTVRVRWQAPSERLESTTYNVVGTVRGNEFPDEVLYLSGHHDSFFYGANDNMSSVACVIEVARALTGSRPRRTWRFIAWGSEECGAEIGSWGIYGLCGSYGYGQIHRPDLVDEGREIAVALLNGEMMGFTPRTHIQCTPELVPFAKSVTRDLGDHLQVSGPSFNWTMSDHLCFHALGLPLMYFLPARDRGSGARPPYWQLYHTEKDDVEHISSRALEENSRMLALLTLRLDGADMPHSLPNLVSEAIKGTESLPNGERVHGLLQEKAERCLQAGTREETLRQTLRFCQVVNRNIYAFDRPFGQKFALIAERIARLRDAYHIISMEGDLERARAVLRSIADFNVMTNYSEETVNQVRRVRESCPVVRDLAVVVTDWSELLDGLAHPEPPDQLLAVLQAKVEEARGMAQSWGRQFEEALRTL